MTHTLHRFGKADTLKNDFIVFSMSAKTVNAHGSAEKMRQFVDILAKYNPLNMGDMKSGNMFNCDRMSIYKQVQDNSIVHFVFTDRNSVLQVLKELKQAEPGISVIVTGLVDTTQELCELVGLKMHTIEFSGGIHGKLQLLPPLPVLEVTAMCGHGMVSANLVKEMVRQINSGKKTVHEAAVELAKPCQCGVFNPARAEVLLLAMCHLTKPGTSVSKGSEKDYELNT